MSKAQTTRSNILLQAFGLIYRQGYQATSIDDIIAKTEVTKGAFFYHFKNKEEMGLAIVNEIMYTGLIPYMKDILDRPGNVRVNLYQMMENLLHSDVFFNVEYGCPAVNLIDEMAPLNKSFHQALSRIMKQWHEAIAAAIVRAQRNGQLTDAHRPGHLATYIIASYSGIRNTGKIMGKAAYAAFLDEYEKFLNQLT
ncbi:TetR family transcriptional regulator [Pedobacter yulinensis]|uniref:TetR family transcriptional regulator n=1 Tax=Pedobacter yulinensis TaxID=2126353 RepID=A0A2T3HR92_9SPHI|nr:TetR/AcrR family transcriptional regulator [Pedobacter yulinensis]PST84958.1 TetR family transcriptional regulator [Pedobacter yulinensis]